MYSALVLASASALMVSTVFGQSLTINSFGGAYEDAHRKCVIAPFEDATGSTVEIVTAYSADALARLRAQRDAPEFDVVHFSGGQEIVAAQEGLLLPIDEASLVNAGDLYDIARSNLEGGEGPAYSIAAIGLVYNVEKTPQAPQSWVDVLDPIYGRHLVLTDISNAYGMLGFLMINQINGGDLGNIEPGLDAVAELLDGGAVVVSTSPELQRAFAEGDAWLAPYASDYAFTLRSSGLPANFAQAAEGAPASFITASLVAGRDNKDLALQFIDMSISKEAQECFAHELRYSPTNMTVELPDAVAADVAYGAGAASGLLRFDPTVIEANRSDWVDMWNRTISR